MKEYLNQFTTNLFNLSRDINRYHETPEMTHFINNFYDQNMAQIILKYHITFSEIQREINDKNPIIFRKPLFLVNNVNISNVWQHLSKIRREKVWAYLKMLLLLSNNIVNPSHLSHLSQSNYEESYNSQIGENTNNAEDAEFDPMSFYEQSLITNDSENNSGIPNMENMFDFESLQNQIQSMTQEDIQEAASNLQGMFNQSNNPEANKFIGDILTNLQEELRNTDITSGNSLKNIMKIGESISAKMERNGSSLDDRQLENMFNAINQHNVPYQGQQVNPLSMMQNLMNNLPQNVKSNGGQAMTQQEYMRQCAEMMKGANF